MQLRCLILEQKFPTMARKFDSENYKKIINVLINVPINVQINVLQKMPYGETLIRTQIKR